MRYAVDTSSLIDLARYYLPFDQKSVLMGRIRALFDNGYFVLLAAVKKEAETTAEKIVIKSGIITGEQRAEENISVPDHHTNQKIDKEWTTPARKERIAPQRYEQRKGVFLASGDCQLILYAKQNEEVTVVSEETETEKERELFKKIPIICKQEEVRCITLSAALKELGLMVDYSWQNPLKSRNLLS